MKNNSRATNEPKFKKGTEVCFYISRPEKEARFEAQIGKIKHVSRGYYYFSGGPKNDFMEQISYNIEERDGIVSNEVDEESIFTKEQALLAFQEWLGKE